jgi:hypothetical protein
MRSEVFETMRKDTSKEICRQKKREDDEEDERTGVVT